MVCVRSSVYFCPFLSFVCLFHTCLSTLSLFELDQQVSWTILSVVTNLLIFSLRFLTQPSKGPLLHPLCYYFSPRCPSTCFCFNLVPFASQAIPFLICFTSLLYWKWPSPWYAVKHIDSCFLFLPSNLPNVSPCLFYLTLASFTPPSFPFFLLLFKKNLWQHGTISEPFVGLRHVISMGVTHWTVREALLFSLRRSTAIPLSPVLLWVWMWFRLWLLCVGMWSVSPLLTFLGHHARVFFFFYFFHSPLSCACLCVVKMICFWRFGPDTPLHPTFYIWPCSHAYIISLSNH